jgi:hypothetical protein
MPMGKRRPRVVPQETNKSMKSTFLIMILVFSISSVHSQGSKDSFIPDTTINGRLKVLNSTSIERYLGSQKGMLIEDERASRVQYVNVAKSTYLILYHLNGANANSFNKFEIGRVKVGTESFRQTTYKVFTSESGIKIGMKLNALLKIKGRKFNKSVEDGFVIVKYQIKEEGNIFLKKYKMPVYEAEYYFQNGKLEKFVFGFPNL